MRYIFIADIASNEAEIYRAANLMTWADIGLRQLENGNYEVIKGEDLDTIVRPENIHRLQKPVEERNRDYEPYKHWEC
jgi:hypothetical protein